MSFFRLRVLNTFLLFLIGIIAGFILKDRFYPQAPKPQPYAAEYKPSYGAAAEPEDEIPAEDLADEEIPEEPAPKAAPRPSVSAETLAGARNGNGDSPIVIEPLPAQRAPKGEAVLGARDEFFRKPSAYAGRELEMDLQMITAKKSARGWRLNFVHTGPDKRIDYLYAEAPGLLGEKPDLRIGYVYSVRFLCEKGETAAGNVISAITPTGEKADWATGLSAVE
ncbi:MAG: hypothetical protein A2X31_04020 [Elusimicrobia bacterium GWB2_63_22]|nr:MAG: hypothetical protein A2X31_04020 [Elusimicrobia bacterium GWB2_63_22]